MQYLINEQIFAAAEKICQQFTVRCKAMVGRYFFKPLAAGKWFPVVQAQHLINSIMSTTVGYILPLLHVLPGKMKMRELCCLATHHSQHHLYFITANTWLDIFEPAIQTSP